MLLVTTATGEDRINSEGELAAAVHHVLAALTDVRPSAVTADLLRDRIALTQWLRGELAAVETLLVGAYDRADRRTTPGS